MVLETEDGEHERVDRDVEPVRRAAVPGPPGTYVVCSHALPTALSPGRSIVRSRVVAWCVEVAESTTSALGTGR